MKEQYIQVCYDLISAYKNGIKEHPQIQMKKLGFNVLYGVAQSISDCWWFTVEKMIEPPPPYIKPMKYDFDYWHGKGDRIVT